MKKTNNFFAAFLIVVCIISSPVFGAGGNEVFGKKLECSAIGKQVTLKYYANHALEVMVDIFNNKGERIYHGLTTASKGFVLPFDMSALPSGEYTFAITEDKDVYIEKVAISETLTEAAAVRVIKTEGKSFAVVSQDAIPADLDLYVYASEGDFIYKASLASDQQLKMMYDLKEIRDQDFEIVIKEGAHVLTSKVLEFE